MLSFTYYLKKHKKWRGALRFAINSAQLFLPADIINLFFMLYPCAYLNIKKSFVGLFKISRFQQGWSSSSPNYFPAAAAAMYRAAMPKLNSDITTQQGADRFLSCAHMYYWQK